jgi:2-dehydropantoate 2-reductase
VTPTVAVLGPGAVGGAIAVRLALSGERLVCVARPETAAAIAEHGLTLRAGGRDATAWPEAVELLDEPVDLLLVAVKAPSLERALGRVSRESVADGVVVSLLNGLEHLELLRDRLGAPTAAGSVSHFQAYRDGPARIVQLTGTLVVTAASEEMTSDVLSAALEPLGAAGVVVRLGESERAVLWEKAARLGPLAAVTALTQQPVGEIRSDPEWRAMLLAAVGESCAAASAEGVPLSPAEEWAIVETMPAGLTTSTARDVAAGCPSELDAIVGSIVRAGQRHRVATPVLDSLLRQLGSA